MSLGRKRRPSSPWSPLSSAPRGTHSSAPTLPKSTATPRSLATAEAPKPVVSFPAPSERPRTTVGAISAAPSLAARGATVPARPSPNQTVHELGLSPPKLLGPTLPSQRRRRSTAAAQFHHRPPAAVESPAPITSTPSKTIQRCGLAPLHFSLPFPSPPVTLLAGKRRALPCSVLSRLPGTSFAKNQNLQGLICKMCLNFKTANFKNA